MNENIKPVAVVNITLYSNGSIKVNGPLHDKILMYGLLHYAMDAISSQKQGEESKIIKPIFIPPGDLGDG